VLEQKGGYSSTVCRPGALRCPAPVRTPAHVGSLGGLDLAGACPRRYGDAGEHGEGLR